jgi:hypothetical protein
MKPVIFSVLESDLVVQYLKMLYASRWLVFTSVTSEIDQYRTLLDVSELLDIDLDCYILGV